MMRRFFSVQKRLYSTRLKPDSERSFAPIKIISGKATVGASIKSSLLMRALPVLEKSRLRKQSAFLAYLKDMRLKRDSEVSFATAQNMDRETNGGASPLNHGTSVAGFFSVQKRLYSTRLKRDSEVSFAAIVFAERSGGAIL